MTAAPLRVGFAKVDLTPPLEAAYLSFHPRLTRFEGIHDRLHARAMAVEAGESRAAIVTFDGLGLSRTVLGRDRDVIELIRQRVHERCGIAPDHLLIAATHAHSTPQTTDLHDLRRFGGIGGKRRFAQDIFIAFITQRQELPLRNERKLFSSRDRNR